MVTKGTMVLQNHHRRSEKGQISIDLIAAMFVYLIALTLVISTIFRTYGFLSNSNFAERADLIADRLSLMFVQSEGSPGWEADPPFASSVGFASGPLLSYGKIQSFAGLGVSQARQLLGITYDHRMRVSYLPSIVMDVGYNNPKMVLTGTAPLNTFSPGEVNVTITTYDDNGTRVDARLWAVLSSQEYGKVSRSDSADGSVSALMVAPDGGGNAAYAARMAASRYAVSYNVTFGGAYTLRVIAVKGNMFGDREVAINVA